MNKKNTRVYGPDRCVSILTLLAILVPALVLMIVVVPSYESVAAIIILEIVSVWMVILNLISYYALYTTDPGIIPKSEKPVNKEFNYYVRLKDVENFNSPADFKLKFCRTCNIMRPPRSFHCSRCDVCIETHDHHCPFVGGWIGLRNHRTFITFLCVTTFVALYAYAVCLPPIIGMYSTAYAEGDESKIINLIISIALLIYVGIMFITLFWFGCSHLWLAMKNLTTNESLRNTYR